MTGALCRELRSAEEQALAHDLVSRKYEAQGYAPDEYFSKYLTSSQASVFGLFSEEALTGTIAIIKDGALGLPMDEIYRDELTPWRAQEKRLAEVVQFAVEHNEPLSTKSLFAAVPLFGAILSLALAEKIEYLCIAINPKHNRFYGLMGFEQIGEPKNYLSVNAPAIARAFHVPSWQSKPLVRSLLGREIIRHVIQ